MPRVDGHLEGSRWAVSPRAGLAAASRAVTALQDLGLCQSAEWEELRPLGGGHSQVPLRADEVTGS